MWTAICVDNADLLEGALAAFERQVQRLREAIGARDGEVLRELFEEARDWAEEEPVQR